MKKLLVTISILLLAAACNQQAQVQTEQNQQTHGETANWKTYTNNEVLGFSIQYPQDWNVSGDFKSASSIVLSNYIRNSNDDTPPQAGEAAIEIQVYKKQANQSLEAFVSQPSALTGKVPQIEKVNIAGIEGIKAKDQGDGTYYLPQSDTQGLRVLVFKDELHEVQHQILSTIKFIYETANWKTYTSKKYGFEVKFNPAWNVKYYKNQGMEVTKEVAPEEANSININGEMYIAVKSSSKTTLDDSLKQFSNVISKKQITVDGQPAYDLVIELPGIKERNILLIRDDGKGGSNIFTIYQQSGSQKEFDQLLSTFKFIK